MPETRSASGLQIQLGYLVIGLCWVWVLWSVAQEFFDPYSGDLDHEFYFGQRVAQGNLPWNGEFINRLPFAQILMAVPASLGGILAWRLCSLGISIICSLVVFRFLKSQIARRYPGYGVMPTLAAHLGILGYFLIMTVVQQGFTQINAVPTGIFVAVSVSLYAKALDWHGDVAIRNLLIPAILLAVALSIRPYFFGPFLVLVLWLTVLNLQIRSIRTEALLRNVGLRLFGIVGVAGLVMNAGPYIVVGEFRVFLDGLKLLLWGTPGVPFTPKAAVFLVSVALFAVAVLFVSRRSILGLESMLSSSVLALIAIILLQHFWGHYASFFSWYVPILVVLVVSRSDKFRDFLERRSTGLEGRIRVTVGTVLLLSLASSFGYGYFLREPLLDVRHQYVVVINELYQRETRDGVSFLAPRDMFSHFYFSEPRRGLPGGAATRPIRDGQWESVIQVDSFATPRSVDEYCLLVRGSGVRFVLIERDYLPQSCFVSSDGQDWPMYELPVQTLAPSTVDVFENPDWAER